MLRQISNLPAMLFKLFDYSKKSLFIKNTFIYTFGIVINRALGFFLIPIYTNYFSVEDYGLLAILNIINQLVSFIFLFGISSSAMRFYFNKDEDPEYQKKMYGTATILLIVLPIILFLLTSPIIFLFTKGFLKNVAFYPYVFIVLLSNLFYPVIQLQYGFFRVAKAARQFIIFSISLFMLKALLCILAITWLRAGILGQLLADLITCILFFAVALRLLIKNSIFKFSKIIAKDLILYGLPLIPYFVLLWIDNASARVMLEKFSSLADVGIYSLAAQFIGIILVFSAALDNSITPYFFETAQKPKGGEIIGKFSLKYLAFFGIVTVFVAIISKPLVVLAANHKYHGAVAYLPLILFSVFFNILYKIFTWSLNFSKKTKVLSALSFISSATLVLLLVITLKILKMGIKGAIYSLIATGMLKLILGYFAADRYFKIKFAFGEVFLILFSITLSIVLLNKLPFSNILYLQSLEKLGLFALVVFVIVKKTDVFNLKKIFVKK